MILSIMHYFNKFSNYPGGEQGVGHGIFIFYFTVTPWPCHPRRNTSWFLFLFDGVGRQYIFSLNINVCLCVWVNYRSIASLIYITALLQKKNKILKNSNLREPNVWIQREAWDSSLRHANFNKFEDPNKKF